MYETIPQIKLGMDISTIARLKHKVSLWLVALSHQISFRPEEQDHGKLKIVIWGESTVVQE